MSVKRVAKLLGTLLRALLVIRLRTLKEHCFIRRLRNQMTDSCDDFV